MPSLYPLGPTHTLTLTLYPFTHTRLDAMHTQLCAVLRLRCLAQGRCGVTVAGTVLLGLQEPRHVFRPPAGKYTFNATESAGAVGTQRIHDHFRWFSLKQQGCEGLKRRFSASVREDCTLPCAVWKLGFCFWGYILPFCCQCFSWIISRHAVYSAGW